MNSKEFVDHISLLHNYDNNLKFKLYKAVSGLISQYNDYKDVIFSALSNCKIIVCKKEENNYDIFKKYSSEDLTIDKNTLINSEGLYFNVPNIIFDGKYIINDTKHYLILKNDYTLDTLIHELSHLIKSFSKPNKIDNNILTEYSGLITNEYELSIINNKIHKELISTKNIGVEEGLTEYDTYKVMSRLDINAKKSYVYSSLINIGEHFRSNDELNKFILEYQFNKSNDIVNDLNFIEISKLCDKIVTLVYQTNYNSNNIHALFENSKLIEPLSNEVHELINLIINKQKKVSNLILFLFCNNH